MELRRPRPVSARRSGLATALAAAAVGCLLAGCSPAVSPPVSDVVTQPTIPGGVALEHNATVTIGVRSLPVDFNPGSPAGDNRITRMVMEQVWPQPFVTDPSYTYESSALLESAEVESVSPLEVQYVLNPAAVWSDGAPITAADFVYDWHERVAISAELPDSGLVAGYRDISSIVGTDGGRTVTVTFRQPFSQWQALFQDLVPSAVAERYGWQAAFTPKAIGRTLSGGPFEIAAYSPGRDLVLERNPKFWGTPAHVAKIEFLEEPSEAAIIHGLEVGTLTIGEVNGASVPAGILTPGGAKVAAALKAQSGRSRQPGTSDSAGGGAGSTVRTSTAASKLSWTSEQANELWQLTFNLSNPVVANVAVRRGIEHSLDRSEIVDDSEDLADSEIQPALSRVLMAGESAAPSSSTSVPIKQRAPRLYKPRSALASFGDASYFPGAGGLLRHDKIGAPLRLNLLVPTDEPVVAAAADVIQGELGDIGVLVTLEHRSLSQIVADDLPEGRFEMALAPFLISPTYAVMAPEYTDPVGVVATTANQAGAGSASATLSASSGTSGAPTTTGPLVPYETWETTIAPETDPGADVDDVVTRDVMGFNDPAVVQDFADSLAELDQPSSLADLERADRVLWSHVVTIPLFQPGYALVRSTRIHNVSESPTTVGIMWDAEDWAVLKPSGSKSST